MRRLEDLRAQPIDVGQGDNAAWVSMVDPEGKYERVHRSIWANGAEHYDRPSDWAARASIGLVPMWSNPSRDENLLDDSATPDEYVSLSPALSAVIDLYGSRARRRHVAIAVMRTLGYASEGTPGWWTLIAFSWLGDELADLLGRRSIAIEASARACASRVAAVRDPATLEADLGLTVRVDGNWAETQARRAAIVEDLFPRIRRVLRRLEAEGVVEDLP